MNLKTSSVLALWVIGAIAGANNAFCDPEDSTKVSSGAALTIYNDNFAVVRDIIPLSLTAGVNHVSFTGITSQVEPDSVILRDPSGKRELAILEQNYRGDTISQGLLLSLNEGKTIDFRVPGTDGGPPTIVQGTIIRSGYSPTAPAYNPYYGYNTNTPSNTPLIEVNGKLEFDLPGTPLFPALTDDSILNPTLEWTLYADKPGPLSAELAYITDGINWNAAYNVVAPNTGADLDLTAWVTMDNESGKEFDNASIKLMAGDVHKILPSQNQSYQARVRITGSLSDSLSSGLATEKDLDEYHLYTLPNTTTLRNHETKQVQFLQAGNIASQEVYTYDGLKLDPNQYGGWGYYNIRNQSDYGTDVNTKVAIEREFVKSKANGLGVPLPAGRVRFYRRDEDGQLEFIGEDNIDHTPKDATVKIVTGNAFDIVGSRTQQSYVIDNNPNLLDESFLITLNNHKDTAVVVTVIEHLYREKNWTIPVHSDPFDKLDAHTIQFKVQVPPNGAKTVTYSAHYTW